MHPAINSAEGLAGLVFLVMLLTTATGAYIATNAVRTIRSVAGLALCFIGVAGIYYYLNSPFVAMMEMLIYVGAVCVVLVFAVMLAEPHPEKQFGKRNGLVGPLSLLVSAIIAWALIALGRQTDWPTGVVQSNNGSLPEVGHALLTTYSMVFELISVVLLVDIIGALVLGRAGRSKACVSST